MPTNQEIADVLYQIADLMEMQEVAFKPQAYRRAAQTIESWSAEIEDVARQGKLEELPGVGKGIAEHIREMINHNGRSLYLEKLKKSLPIKADELFSVEGLGPKRAMMLYKRLKVTDLASLEKAARAGKIAKIERFGEATQEKILSGIEFARKARGRMLLSQALPIAERIIATLKKAGPVSNIAYAGSLRRKSSTIGDIDILVTTKKPKELMSAFVKMKEAARVVASGPTKSTIEIRNGPHADLRVLDPAQWGSALQYFTGSKNHNIALRRIAIAKGYKLSEYGLFKGTKNVACKTEHEIYRKLGMEYIEPELREDNGEIKAAQEGKLPKLVELYDLRGDLHTHSAWSDGTASILEMAQAAASHGLDYIALTDHTEKLKIANGLTAKRFEKQADELRGLSKKLGGFQILHGCELNIMEDGTPDVPDSTLKNFDIVVASIHHGLGNDRSKATRRLVTAISNPHIDIIGHPTGRLIGRRAGYEINLDAVIDACKEHNKALEINSQPERLDLDFGMVRECVKRGVRVSISSDSHATDSFHFLEFGVCNARRGWCEKKDVINTMGAEKVREWVRKHD